MPEFIVIHGPKDEPKENWKPYVTLDGTQQWDNPQAANEIVKELNARFKNNFRYAGYAAMMQKLPEQVDYIVRETAREDYQPFEIQGEAHHCSELKKDGTISYYNTIHDAYADRRSNMKIGRYLHKYTDKDDKEIGEICARYGYEFGDATVHFAKTREEIKRVYENGPNSCMSGRAGDYGIGNGVHPAEAYASGDFEVAYLTRDERITARAVVIPSKKVWACIYGDSGRLQPALMDLGYKHYEYEEAHGMKLLRVQVDNRIAAPYFDFNGCISELTDDGKYMIIGDSGACSSEEGYIYDDLTEPYEEDDDYDWYD